LQTDFEKIEFEVSAFNIIFKVTIYDTVNYWKQKKISRPSYPVLCLCAWL